MKVCIGLPTKNERENIDSVVARVRKACKGADIVVFDEYSTDGTIDAAKKLKVPIVQRRKGYGEAMKAAIAYATEKKYDVLAVLDCDQTYPPEELPELIKFLPEYDFVIGVRNLDTLYPKLHRIPNKIHTVLANILFFCNLKDINSGMWAFKPEKFHNQLETSGFDFSEEIKLRAVKNKYKIKQVKINYGRREGKSKIKIMDGFIDIWRIVYERFRP